MQFIDSARFMASLLSNLVDNFGEGIKKIKCKYERDKDYAERVKLNTKIVRAFLNTQALRVI